MLIVNSYDGGEMYEEYFRMSGIAVDLARTPEAALAIVERTAPDVIVSDLVFVGSAMTGAAFIRAVRERLGSRVKVIAVSGLVRDCDERSAREAGADVFLIKPCPPETLRQHVDGRKQRASTAQRSH